MDMEMKDDLATTMDRLTAAAGLLEQLADRLAQRQTDDLDATIGRIVATVEARRETELETKLAAAEARIAELEAATESGAPSKLRLGGSAATEHASGRKTLPSSMTTLLAKQGVASESLETASLEAGAVDAALASLSLEQRIAVKAQLLRAGLLS